MGSKKYSKALWCLSTVMLAGSLQAAEANAAEVNAAVVRLRPDFVAETKTMSPGIALDIKEMWRAIGAKNRYIEGTETLCERALLQAADTETDGEIMLFQRKKSIAGTRVYANVLNYVNVREAASTTAAAVGKLYADCVATVIEDAGDWVYVNSGNVTGYVVKKYLLMEDAAEEAIARTYSPKIKVTANTLNIRSGAGTEYKIIGGFTLGEEAELLEKGTDWMKIRFSSGTEKMTGYVFAKYVTVTGEPKVGETLAEESARIAAEKKAAAEAAARAEAEKKAAAEQAKRDKAKQVADYARTAVGTAYVWGGTNLKTGVDCSGLCYAAYKAYGYTLPRVSRDMAASSALLSVTPNKTYLKAGDLVFYASGGTVDHVAMYIGDGRVVHASDYKTGVIISYYNYRTPHSAKRVIY